MRITATTLAGLCVLTHFDSARADVVTLGANHDTTLYSESNSESNGAGSSFFSGVNGMGQIRRGLISFDIAGGVPAGATIIDVQLTLSMSNSNAGVRTIGLHAVTNSWGESTSTGGGGGGGGGEGGIAAVGDATWNRRFYNTISWATLGGDFVPTASAETDVNGIGFYTWGSTPDMVANVQSWLDSPASNFGWLLKNNETEQPTAKRFDSRQHAFASVRPKLVVIYSPANCGTDTTYCLTSPNSVGDGALIGHTGSRSIFTNDFVLTTSGCPPNAFGRYFYGMTATAPVTFGNGFRCIQPFIRLPTLFADGSGDVAFPLDFNALPPEGLINPGETWNFQFWYRNPAGGGANFNASDGLQTTFCL